MLSNKISLKSWATICIDMFPLISLIDKLKIKLTLERGRNNLYLVANKPGYKEESIAINRRFNPHYKDYYSDGPLLSELSYYISNKTLTLSTDYNYAHQTFILFCEGHSTSMRYIIALLPDYAKNAPIIPVHPHYQLTNQSK